METQDMFDIIAVQIGRLLAEAQSQEARRLLNELMLKLFEVQALMQDDASSTCGSTRSIPTTF